MLQYEIIEEYLFKNLLIFIFIQLKNFNVLINSLTTKNKKLMLYKRAIS